MDQLFEQIGLQNEEPRTFSEQLGQKSAVQDEKCIAEDAAVQYDSCWSTTEVNVNNYNTLQRRSLATSSGSQTALSVNVQTERTWSNANASIVTQSTEPSEVWTQFNLSSSERLSTLSFAQCEPAVSGAQAGTIHNLLQSVKQSVSAGDAEAVNQQLPGALSLVQLYQAQDVCSQTHERSLLATLMQEAASLGHVEVVKVLLRIGSAYDTVPSHASCTECTTRKLLQADTLNSYQSASSVPITSCAFDEETSKSPQPQRTDKSFDLPHIDERLALIAFAYAAHQEKIPVLEYVCKCVPSVQILFKCHSFCHSGESSQVLQEAVKGRVPGVLSWLLNCLREHTFDNKSSLENVACFNYEAARLHVTNILNAENGNGLTPLMLAVQHDEIVDTQAIVELIDAGADMNFQQSKKEGNTALHFAVKYCSLNCITQLLQSGADINMQNCNGDSPLLAAIDQARAHVAKQIIEKDANCWLRNKLGETIFHKVFKVRLQSLYDNLWEACDCFTMGQGAQSIINFLNEPNSKGETALFIACSQGLENEAIKLIELGVNPCLSTPQGATPLHSAVIKGQRKLVQKLLDLKVPIADKLTTGESVLHIAAHDPEKIDILEMLLDRVSEVDNRRFYPYQLHCSRLATRAMQPSYLAHNAASHHHQSELDFSTNDSAKMPLQDQGSITGMQSVTGRAASGNSKHPSTLSYTLKSDLDIQSNVSNATVIHQMQQLDQRSVRPAMATVAFELQTQANSPVAGYGCLNSSRNIGDQYISVKKRLLNTLKRKWDVKRKFKQRFGSVSIPPHTWGPTAPLYSNTGHMVRTKSKSRQSKNTQASNHLLGIPASNHPISGLSSSYANQQAYHALVGSSTLAQSIRDPCAVGGNSRSSGANLHLLNPNHLSSKDSSPALRLQSDSQPQLSMAQTSNVTIAHQSNIGAESSFYQNAPMASARSPSTGLTEQQSGCNPHAQQPEQQPHLHNLTPSDTSLSCTPKSGFLDIRCPDKRLGPLTQPHFVPQREAQMWVIANCWPHSSLVNHASARGVTPLQVACMTGNVPAVRLLLKHGALVHKPDSEGGTALMWAVFNDHQHGNGQEIVDLLVQRCSATGELITEQLICNVLRAATQSAPSNALNKLFESLITMLREA